MAIRVDPRIRARRIAVRRAEGRRRLRFLAVALGLVALAVGAWGLSRSSLLDLDHVRVDGLSGREQAVVEEAIGLERGTPLIDLDLDSVEATVGALPWVATVHAERDWPGTVRVVVEPRVPVAVVGSVNGGRLLIDAEGVLTGAAPADSPLPAISVESARPLGAIEPAALAGISVVTAMPDDLYPWIEAVTVAAEPGPDGRSIVGLDLLGNAVVEMGPAELIDGKLAAVRAVLESTELSCIDAIDVIVADLPIVTRDFGCID